VPDHKRGQGKQQLGKTFEDAGSHFATVGGEAADTACMTCSNREVRRLSPQMGPPRLTELPAGLADLARGEGGVLMGVGIVGAGLLAAVVISLSSAWAWAEVLHWPHSLNLSIRKAPAFYAVHLVEIIPGAVVALLASNLVSVVIQAMVLNVVVLALPLAFLIRLCSDREVLGDLVNSKARSAVLWTIAASFLFLGVWSTISLIHP
jgi:Mn2+/Fe2+ NRAMP family transporter